MGGVLSVLYLATHSDHPVKNLVCLTTPIDFSKVGMAQSWSSESYFDVDHLVDTLGIIPEDFVRAGFELLRPAARTAGQLRLWTDIDNTAFVNHFRALERWGNETLPLPGEYFRETTKALMWKNALRNDELEIAGRSAQLSRVTIPILHVLAEHDHIVPCPAGKPLLEKVGSLEKDELILKGGHVSLIAGGNARKRMWPAVSEWLSGRSV